MAPDGSIHPSTDTIILVKLLEDVVVNDIYITLLRNISSLKKDRRRVLWWIEWEGYKD